MNSKLTLDSSLRDLFLLYLSVPGKMSLDDLVRDYVQPLFEKENNKNKKKVILALDLL